MEFKYLDYVCNGCNDLLILRVNISNIGIIAVKGVDYCCIPKKSILRVKTLSFMRI